MIDIRDKTEDKAFLIENMEKDYFTTLKIALACKNNIMAITNFLAAA